MGHPVPLTTELVALSIEGLPAWYDLRGVVCGRAAEDHFTICSCTDDNVWWNMCDLPDNPPEVLTEEQALIKAASWGYIFRFVLREDTK